MESKYFIERIEDLEQLLTLIPPELLREDLSRLVVNVLECVRKARNIEDLNRTLLARTRVDIDTLRQVADILEKLDLGGPHDLFPTRSLDPRSILADYRSFIESLDRDAQTVDALDLSLRLNYFSGALMDLMLCAAVVQADLTPIIRLVRQKLTFWMITRLWICGAAYKERVQPRETGINGVRRKHPARKVVKDDNDTGDKGKDS